MSGVLGYLTLAPVALRRETRLTAVRCGEVWSRLPLRRNTQYEIIRYRIQPQFFYGGQRGRFANLLGEVAARLFHLLLSDSRAASSNWILGLDAASFYS